MEPYTYFESIAEQLPEIPPDSILSRTVITRENLKMVLFGFAAGQELSEHTSAQSAILHFIAGEAELTLGDDSLKARPGTWVHMPPGLPHSILAKTPVTMLLLMLKAS